MKNYSPASPSFSPWHNGDAQPAQLPTAPTAPEAVKNKSSNAGSPGPSGHELPDQLQCPCGSGSCAVYTSRTAKNPNRKFYKCQKCGFFKWCDESGQSSQSPLKKPSQGFSRSPKKINKPDSSPSKPDQPICSCKAGPCIVLIMHEGENKGRKYYACSIKKGYGACNHFEWVDGPVKPPEPENNLNENQNYSSIIDVATPEPKQTLSPYESVKDLFARPEPKQTLPPYESVKDLFATPEPKQTLPPYESVKDLFATPEPKQTLSPYESVKDLFGENDMTTIEYWCKDQNDPKYPAVTTHNETRKQSSPGKGPPQLIGVSEISPMKRLNVDDANPAVANCLTCGAIGQCIKCPILACFKDDDFADGKHENSLDGGNNSNFVNISPVEWPSVQNVKPSPSPSPDLNSSSFKRSGILF